MTSRINIPLVALALGAAAIAGCEDAEVEDIAAPAPAAVGENAPEVDVEEAAGDVAEVAAPAPAAAAELVDDDPAEPVEEPTEIEE